MENPKVEEPLAEQPKNNYPDYVKELINKGVVVLMGRSKGELDEKIAAIPSDVDFYTGAVDHYLDTGLYRIQVNIKK